MMKTILILLPATVILSWAVLYIIRRLQSKIMRKKIAAEGFETAIDILYPHKRRRFSKYRMGPVL
jgi:hypothetical protein